MSDDGGNAVPAETPALGGGSPVNGSGVGSGAALETVVVVEAPVPDETVNATVIPAARRHTQRFLLIYALLGAAVAGAVAVLFFGFVAPKVAPTPPWSTWVPPSGTTAKVADAIATHVAAQYHLNKTGSQLVAVVSGPPLVTSGTRKVSISAIAIQKNATSTNGIQIFYTPNTWTDEFCGLGTNCAISTGKATVTRGQLVRREALEVALYTFKFAPAITSLVAYLPPPPGSAATTLLYFQKSQLTRELSEPLDKTLTLKTPPLPSVSDTVEEATINKLTLPDVFSYSLTQLQDGSAALVLAPIVS